MEHEKSGDKLYYYIGLYMKRVKDGEIGVEEGTAIIYDLVSNKLKRRDLENIQNKRELEWDEDITEALTKKSLFLYALELFDKNLYVNVLLFDVDNFKPVNDSHESHGFGNAALNDIVSRVKHVLKDQDQIGRWLRGDEYAVLIATKKPMTIRGLARIGERARQSVAASPIVVEGEELNLTISIGGVVGCKNVQELQKALEIADKKLYVAKKMGRNRVEIYNGNINGD